MTRISAILFLVVAAVCFADQPTIRPRPIAPAHNVDEYWLLHLEVTTQLASGAVGMERRSLTDIANDSFQLATIILTHHGISPPTDPKQPPTIESR